MIKKVFSFLWVLLTVQLLAAQAPQGYYGATKGTHGSGLKTALHQIIKGHKSCSYDALLTHFRQTDRRADGKVWDMYSSITNYSFSGRSARYGGEGGGYNREHSFPKSWFGGKVAPMNSDLFHLYPTDGYVNNRRSNYPFGETDGEMYQSAGGWSKVGSCTTPGYSGTVFEPNDEYKGDFARTYFYMATRYEDQIAGWKNTHGEVYPMLNSTSYPVFSKWALDMLLRWAKNDPVSQKEIDRNNAVYQVQENRNPYIDFPGLEQYVWGDKVNVTFDPNTYGSDDGGDVDPDQPDDHPVAAPRFSLTAGEVTAGTMVEITCATPDVQLFYRINDEAWQQQAAPVQLTVDRDMTLTAYARLDSLYSDTVSVRYVLASAPVVGSGIFRKIESEDQLTLGSKYLIVCESKSTALAGIEGKDSDIRSSVSVEIKNNTVTTAVAEQGLPYALTLNRDEAGYFFYDEATDTYLALTSNKNKLYSIADGQSDAARWSISLLNGNTMITSLRFDGRSIKYNAQAPRFATYTTGQENIALYKETVGGGEVTVAAPVFSVAPGEVEKGTVVSITTPTPQAVLHYALNNDAWQTQEGEVRLTITEDTEIMAYAQLGEAISATVKATYTVPSTPIEQRGVYVKVTDNADLEAGAHYLLVAEEFGMALSEPTGSDLDIRGVAYVEPVDGVLTTDVSASGLPYVLTLGGNSSGYTLYDATSNCYLAFTGKSNRLPGISELSGNDAYWTIQINGGIAEVRSVKDNNRMILYNDDQPRFVAYTATSGQHPVSLFKETTPDGIDVVFAPNTKVDVYTLDGRLVRRSKDAGTAVSGLPRGIYLIGGRKVMVR